MNILKTDFIVIRKLSYLKTPLFDWTYHTKEGGSFSNSGQHKSLKKCAQHLLAMHSNKQSLYDLPLRFDDYLGWDAEEKAVILHNQTHLLKLVGVL